VLEASMVVVGDELLGGYVTDVNSPLLAQRLRDHGVPLTCVHTVADDLAAIDEALTLELAHARPRLIVTSGGIGSTPDDLTYEAVAASLGLELVEDPTMATRIAEVLAWSAEQGVEVTDAFAWHVGRMARIPAGSRLLHRPDGWAPGVLVDVDGGLEAGGAGGGPMTRRLLFVHAHPDDEASKGAATAARYVDDGAEVVLVTCTGGEAGDVLNPSAEASPPERWRDPGRELEAAVAAIGFTRTHELGYVDSGYHEDPADGPRGHLLARPLDEPSRTLAALVRRERPHVVVTYPEDGGYPHPDHIMNHLVTMRALELAEDPDADLGDHLGAELPPWRVPRSTPPRPSRASVPGVDRLVGAHAGEVAAGHLDERLVAVHRGPSSRSAGRCAPARRAGAAA
jgi:LmbE family N-acetylglucosaminyl deacetylase